MWTRAFGVGATGAAAFGIAVALVTIFDIGGVHGLIPAQFLFTAMKGFVLANAVAGALSSANERAGAASAVVGAIQYGSGMIGSGLVGMFANGTPIPMGIVMSMTASAAC